MQTRLLVDAIVRQTTVLIGQLCTAAGFRAPLAQVADQVFLGLARELEAQGVGRKVAADMFGLALRSYQKKIQRLSESATFRLALPRAVDSAMTVYRVDLRDYDWDRPIRVGGETFADGWEALAAHTDYAFELSGDEADTIASAVGTRVFVLPGDAFAFAASREALYYGLLDLPSDLRSLAEDDLGVDLEAGGLRAGTTASLISFFDRRFERHEIEIRSGSLWLAFDGLEEGAAVSMFEDPLGDQGDGSVALFTLPNGLNAFAVFDADGELRGESDLLFDTLQEDFVVRAGISCFGCHAGGLLPFVDEVRPFVEANPFEYTAEVFEAVQDRYPRAEEGFLQLEADNVAYVGALERLGLSADLADPISTVALRYGADLSVSAMAASLLVSEADFLAARSLLPSALRRDRVGRGDFTAAYLEAFCSLHAADDNQAVACLR